MNKPTIPQYVADWVEEHKKNYKNWDNDERADFVIRCINDLFRFGEGLSCWDFNITQEISEYSLLNPYKFITAILHGYKVEKEQLYYVKFIKDEDNSYLNLNKFNRYSFTSGSSECDNIKTRFTLKEIEEINPNYLPFAVKEESESGGSIKYYDKYNWWKSGGLKS